MESWSFPPAYDPEYFPERSSRYWFPRRETMPSAEREKAILARLQEVTRYAYERAPFYRRKWDDAGFHPDKLKSLEDFEDKVPVITSNTTATGVISESVSYLDVGLKLDVEPSVLMRDDVQIKVGLEVSNIVREIRSGSGTLTKTGAGTLSFTGTIVSPRTGATIITGSPVTWFLAVTSMLKPERSACSLMMVRRVCPLLHR